MILTGITARVGNTTWELVRVDNATFRQMTAGAAGALKGHPAYYRILEPEPVDEGDDFDGWNDEPRFQVWPLPLSSVELIPKYDLLEVDTVTSPDQGENNER